MTAKVIALIPDLIPFPWVVAIFVTTLSATYYLRSLNNSHDSIAFVVSIPCFYSLLIFPCTLTYPRFSATDTKMHTATTTRNELLLSPDELAKFNNADPSLPVYVAIKGQIFDVSSNREAYPHATGYGIFAGIDASKALGKSSLDKSDCSPDWHDLSHEQIKVLDDWLAFYEKKYPKVGRVVTSN